MIHPPPSGLGGSNTQEMKGASGAVKKKPQVLNEAGEAETAVETVGESRKISGDGGFGSDDGGGGGGGGSGESILREIGDDRPTEDGDEEEEEDEDEDDGGDEEDEEGEGEGGQEERPKLDEGFYEIEAIRRKRVRKVSSFFRLHSANVVCFC